MAKVGLLDDWDLSFDEINELLTANPSLRSFIMGYAAEMKVRRLWFSDDRVSDVKKYDDHDRTKKGDLAFTYRGHEIKVEVKSLQSLTIKSQLINGEESKVATFQCDASDRRKVTFPDGSRIESTCLLVGEFDLLAVNLFMFNQEWVFAFAKNADLPRSKHKRYSDYIKQHLLASSMPISSPVRPPYRLEPWSLLDELVEEKERGVAVEIEKEAIEVEDLAEHPKLPD